MENLKFFLESYGPEGKAFVVEAAREMLNPNIELPTRRGSR